MRDTKIGLSNTMIAATVMWLVGNGHKDMNAKLKLSTLVQCYRELGILRGNPKQIWRQLNRTRIPANFPGTEVLRVALEIVFACRVSAHWQESAEKWIDDNRAMLIERRALDPEAPRLCVLQVAANEIAPPTTKAKHNEH